MWYVSSNRDEARFEDPDRFDVRRNPEHQAFGAGGRHFCLGTALARLELKIMLEETLKRYPHIELAGDPRLRRIAVPQPAEDAPCAARSSRRRAVDGAARRGSPDPGRGSLSRGVRCQPWPSTGCGTYGSSSRAISSSSSASCSAASASCRCSSLVAPDDRRGHARLVQQPGERDLRRRHAALGGDLGDALDDVEVGRLARRGSR